MSLFPIVTPASYRPRQGGGNIVFASQGGGAPLVLCRQLPGTGELVPCVPLGPAAAETCDLPPGLQCWAQDNGAVATGLGTVVCRDTTRGCCCVAYDHRFQRFVDVGTMLPVGFVPFGWSAAPPVFVYPNHWVYDPYGMNAACASMANAANQCAYAFTAALGGGYAMPVVMVPAGSSAVAVGTPVAPGTEAAEYAAKEAAPMPSCPGDAPPPQQVHAGAAAPSHAEVIANMRARERRNKCVVS